MTDFRRLRGAATAALLAAAFLAACSPMRESRGYVPDEEALSQVRPGVHDRASVAQLLGSPTSVGSFNGATWYYISRKTEQLAFFAEQATDQQVVAIAFDEQGIVQDIRHYTLQDGEPVELVQRETPTRGRELTLLEQLFGNLGRFNSADQRQ